LAPSSSSWSTTHTHNTLIKTPLVLLQQGNTERNLFLPVPCSRAAGRFGPQYRSAQSACHGPGCGSWDPQTRIPAYVEPGEPVIAFHQRPCYPNASYRSTLSVFGCCWTTLWCVEIWRLHFTEGIICHISSCVVFQQYPKRFQQKSDPE
jgi:hypothetical protein